MKQLLLVLALGLVLVGCGDDKKKNDGPVVPGYTVPPLVPAEQPCPEGKVWQGDKVGCLSK